MTFLFAIPTGVSKASQRLSHRHVGYNIQLGVTNPAGDSYQPKYLLPTPQFRGNYKSPKDKASKDKEISIKKATAAKKPKEANPEVKITSRIKSNVPAWPLHWSGVANPWEEVHLTWNKAGIKSMEERRKQLKSELKIVSDLVSAKDYETFMVKALSQAEKLMKQAEADYKPYHHTISCLKQRESYLEGMLKLEPKDKKTQEELKATRQSLDIIQNGKLKEAYDAAQKKKREIKVYEQKTDNGFPITPDGISLPAISSQFFTLYTSTKAWSQGPYNSRLENLEAHLRKHWDEFKTGDLLGERVRNIQDYKRIARKFTENPPPGTEMKVYSNGDVAYYNPEMNLYSVIQKDGTPKTLFKPDGLTAQDKYNVFRYGSIENLERLKKFTL